MSGKEEWKRLWTTDAGKYVLVRVDTDVQPAFVIVERATKTALIIEDDDTYRQVVDEMQRAGVEQTDTFPS